MFTSVIATLTWSLPKGPDILYSARYYFQGKKQSYHQIYLARHDGTSRKQVTFSRFGSHSPIWINKNEIAFVEAYAEDKKSGKQRCQIVRLNLQTEKKKVIQQIGDFYDWRLYSSDGRIHAYGDDGADLYFAFVIGTLQMVDHQLRTLGEGMPTVSEDEDHHTIEKPPNGQAIKYEVLLRGAKPQILVKWSNASSKSVQHKMLGQVIESIQPVRGGDFLVTTTIPHDKYNMSHWVYRVSADLKRSTKIIYNIGNVFIDPKYPIWTGDEADGKGTLAELKDGRGVDVHYLYTGNWQTGKRWTIADGLVDVGGYDLRKN